MSIEIGRLHSFGLGTEITAGTEGAIDTYIPLTSGTFKSVITKKINEQGLGVIDSVSGSNIVEKKSEFTGEGSIKSLSFGWLLLLAFGTSSSPTTVETGVYSHNFTRKNDNNPITTTIFHVNATQQEKSVYHAIDTLDMDFSIGERANFSVKTMGRKVQNASGLTAVFPASDEDFLVNCITVKIANNVAGLTGATPISTQKVSLSLQKNLIQKFGTRTGATCDFEFNTQHNQAFAVSGDMEFVFTDKLYQEIYEFGDYKAMEIKLTGASLIGATKYNEVTFVIPRLSLESFEMSSSLDEIGTQTLGFVGMYDATSGTTTRATVQNTKATQYL